MQVLFICISEVLNSEDIFYMYYWDEASKFTYK